MDYKDQMTESGLPMSTIIALSNKRGTIPQQGMDPTGGQEIDPSTPQVSVDVSSDDPGLLDTVVDVGKGIIGGVGDAINETSDFIHGAANWVDNKLGTHVVNERNEWRLPEMKENVTAYGKLARGVSQFAAGFVGAGKLLKAAKVLQGTSKYTTLARGMAEGAITDAVAFDGHDERLSNLIEEFPELSNPITRYLSSKDSDTDAEGRFKNALEGLALGGLTEPIFAGVKAIKQMRGAKTVAEKARIQEEVAEFMNGKTLDTEEAVEDVIVNELTSRRATPADEANKLHDEFADAARAPRQVQEEAAGDAGARQARPAGLAEFAEAGSTKSNREYKAKLNVDEFYQVISNSKNMDEALDLAAESVNFERWLFEDRDQETGLRGLADALFDKTVKSKGKEAHETIYRESVDMLTRAGFNTDKIIEMAQSGAKKLAELARETYVARMTLGALVKESTRIATLIDTGRYQLKDLVMFHLLHKDVQDLHIAVADMRTGWGRGLSSQKMTVDLGNLPDTKMKVGADTTGDVAQEAAAKQTIRPEDIRNMTEEQIRDYMVRNGLDPNKIKQTARIVRMADGDPLVVSRIMNRAFSGSKWGLYTEYWMNSLLSGYKTQIVNITGNTIKSIMMPAEKIIGGAMMSDNTMIREGLQTYTGMVKFFGDAIGCAKRAFIAENNILDAGHSVFDAPSHQISYENIKRLMLSSKMKGASIADLDAAQLSPVEELVARSMEYLGRVIRLPSRFLLTGDEFFKQLNFRANLYAKLHTEALEKFGRNGDPDVMARWVMQEMDTYFERGGRAVDFNAVEANARANSLTGQLPPDVEAKLKRMQKNSDSSLRYAQEATWTQALGYGYGQSLQRLAAEHPTFRIVMPFIRTPTNIFRDFVAHTPGIANLTKRYKAAIAQGGEAAAIAKGQLATGSMLWITGISLAHSGMLTGAPPKDKKELEQLRATGWQPWSVKIDGKYYPYNRLDPIGMFLGMAADLNRVFQELDTEDAGDVAAHAMIALTHNLASKSYLRGLVNALQAIMDPDRNAMSFIKGLAASHLPFSGLMRNIRMDIADDHMREARGLLDYIMNTIPGMSDDLPAKRNWVTGKPIDYVMVGQDKNDPVFDELLRLGKAIPGAPDRRIYGNNELTPQQYSRLLELHGTIKLQGKTLYERLDELFRSKKYDINRERFDDPPLGMEGGPRAEVVKKIITAYRNAAKKQLLREDRDLLAKVEATRRRNTAIKKGALTRSTEEQFANLLQY
jgi:hypothetical protein